MKLKIKNQINQMRVNGLTASVIAKELGMSVNTIRAHIRRHPEIDGACKCLFCGNWVIQPPGRKPKKFCSDKCRISYWNAQRQGGKNEND